MFGGQSAISALHFLCIGEVTEMVSRTSFRTALPGWLLLVAMSGLVGCATYQGPRDLVTPGGRYQSALDPDEEEEVGPSAAATGPTISLRGERTTERRQARDGEIQFDWPVEQARLSRGYLLGRRWHYGIDLAAPKGTAILASAPGKVIYTGRGFTGYGNLVVIEHGDRWATLYAHLNRFSVREGDLVSRGEKIGEMGRTGRASGVHLHFEIRYNREPVNPLMYLPEGY